MRKAAGPFQESALLFWIENLRDLMNSRDSNNFRIKAQIQFDTTLTTRVLESSLRPRRNDEKRIEFARGPQQNILERLFQAFPSPQSSVV